MHHLEFETSDELRQHLEDGKPFIDTVFQGLDLTPFANRLAETRLRGAVFLGCTMPDPLLRHALAEGALVFPRIAGKPFEPYRPRLYTPHDLLGDYEPGVPGSYEQTLDGRIYAHYVATGGPRPSRLLETLARRLHDHAITDALDEFIEGRRVVAIMGGHSMARGPGDYLAIARLSRLLTRQGYLMASGGGPGAMEATHVGAWFARRADDELTEAVQRLAHAPHYTPIHDWLDAAFAVKAAYPLPTDDPPVSLGIPTWHYGHEPPNAFATHIAKYFANSVREDGLLTIARYGVVYAPGSAGTIQEIFQDAAQNHYETTGFASPMVLFGSDYWTRQKPVFPLLRTLAEGRPYSRWLKIMDRIDDVVAFLDKFTPPETT